MKRIIFAGTPHSAANILQQLLAAQVPIIGCLTQPDKRAGRGRHLQISPVKEIANQHQLPLLQPARLDSEALVNIQSLQPDLILVVAYGMLLPQSFLDLAKYGCLNVHFSLLPRWRGASPIQQAILAGDNKTGITIMQMVQALDAGPVVAMQATPIAENDNSATLTKKLVTLSTPLLLNTLDNLTKINPKPQDEAQVTYAPKISKAAAKIDWQQSATQINNAIRAFNPHPIAHTELDSKVIRVWEACVSHQPKIPNNTAPGTILDWDKQGLHVASTQGIVSLKTLQLPGKKALGTEQLRNSYQQLFQPGAQFK